MTKEVKKAVLNALKFVTEHNLVRSTTIYLSNKLIVRASRPVYGPKGKKRILKGGNQTFILTIGKPNHDEREAIKRFERDNVKFPVSGVKTLSKKK